MLRSFLAKPAVVSELAKVLPRNLPADRLIRQTLTLAQTNPQLLECSPISILAGMIRAAELNLELSGVLGHAYLVPRWNSKTRCKEATFQIGYRGFIALAFRSGQVQSFPMRVVHERDEFSVRLGSNQEILHKPYMDGERGNPIAYYALVKLAGGGEDFEIMTHAECVAHRLKYSPPSTRRDGSVISSVWDSNFDEMALKTVARKLSKRLPLSVEVQAAVQLDDAGERGYDPPPELNARNAEMAARLGYSEGPVQPYPDPEPAAPSSDGIPEDADS